MNSHIFQVAAQYILMYTIATLSISFALLVYRYSKYRRSFSNLPTFNFDIKILYLWLMGKIPKDFTSFIFQETLSYIKLFDKDGMVLTWLFQPVLMVYSQEYTRILSVDRFATSKSPIIYNVLEDLIGKSIVTSNGAVWKSKRKMLNPGFRLERFKDSVALMNEEAHIMIQKLEELCYRPTVDVLDILKLGVLKLFCGSMLGIDVSSEEWDHKMRRYLKHVKTLSEYSMSRITWPWLYWRRMSLLFPIGRKHEKLYREFHDISRDLRSDMMKSYSARSGGSGEESEVGMDEKSFIRILMENYAKDSSCTLKQIQDDIATVTFAGHDTLAHTLLWCLYMLGLNPEIQNKAYEEALSVIGENTEYSFSDVNELSYLECVIKETLRLYPTVPIYGRIADKSIECNKYKIPKGTNIIFVPYVLHRNPEYFPDPERFDPERFTGDVKPWTYVPFAEGARNCIGKKYAMMAMKIFLAHILQKFEITSLDKREDIQLSWKLLLTPAKPLRFYLTHRPS